MILAAGVMMLIAQLAARAQSCTVNATTDTGASGDIAYCVNQANAAPANSTFTINFGSSINGQTIVLTSTLTLAPTQIGVTISIQGPGANLLTISGNNAVGVFSTSNAGPTVNISGLTIANGNGFDAGGIVNWGSMTVSNCTFTGNADGAILNAQGSLTVSNSTFFGNTGSAIASIAALTVNNSTFSGNSTPGGGGGIYENAGSLTVNNSTFSGNSAGNGGAIYNASGTLAVSNTILTGDSPDDCEGNGCPTNGGGNVVGVAANLASLGWYGGATETMIPLPGSPAIGAGQVAASDNPGTDQRGFLRNSTTGATIDAGAVQTNYLIVTSTADTNDPSPGCDAHGDSPCSLRDAITLIKNYPSPYSSGVDIGFASGVTGTIDLSTVNQPLISQFNYGIGLLDMVGPGPGSLTISGGNSASVGSIFLFQYNTKVAISGLTIANGAASVGGGGVYNDGTLTVSNCAFNANAGSSYGGGMWNEGTLTVSNCTFSGNTAYSGGGIENDGTLLTVSNSTFAGNSGQGGGISNNSSLTAMVSNSTFSGNSASGGDGGGIYNNGYASMTVSNSTFSGNTATYGGGGIYNNGPYGSPPTSVTVINSTFSGNTATYGGGALATATQYGNSSLAVSNSILTADSTSECYGNGCPTDGSNGNVVQQNPTTPILAPLGNYGGPTQTMLPLPGSEAICLGSPALAAGLGTDQRGFPRLNTTYTGFSVSNPCVDAGAVQTNYRSVQFTNAGNSGYSGTVNTAVNTPAAPIVSVTENSQNIAGVPVTLTFSGSGTATGLGPVTTAAGTGATFSNLTVSAGGSDTLSATLNITSSNSVSITTGSVALDITSPATTTTVSATPSSATYGQPVTLLATVSSGSATPTGSVSFSIDGQTAVPGSALSSCLGSPADTACSSYSTSTLAVGTHSVQASYTPTGGFQGSNGNTTVTVSQATATVTLGNLTVTYNGSPQSPMVATTPSGLSTSLSGAPDTNAGSYSVKATITNPNYTGSASGNFVINKATTTTKITTITPNPSVSGQGVTVSFSVTPQLGGTPTGMVTVTATTGENCSATLPSSTSCVLTFSTSGSRTVTASYGGDSNFNGSPSAGVTQNVGDFSISASPASQTISSGHKATYTLTLASLGGLSGSISLGCSGGPPNSTCTISPSSISLNGTAKATVTLSTPQNLNHGTWTLTFTGTYGSGNPATGGLTHSTTASLTVK